MASTASCSKAKRETKNGNRQDNRIEKLELWTKAHGAGQRSGDMVAEALRVLSMHQTAWLATNVKNDLADGQNRCIRPPCCWSCCKPASRVFGLALRLNRVVDRVPDRSVEDAEM